MASPTPQVANGWTALVDLSGATLDQVAEAARSQGQAADVGTTWSVLTSTLSATLPQSLSDARAAAARIRAGGV